MNQKFLLPGWFVLCFFCHGYLASQQITRVEYFFDQDPGFGNGISVALTSSEELQLNFQADVMHLTNGFHKLYVRAYVPPYTITTSDSVLYRGGWSHTFSRQFYKEDIPLPATAKQITGGEYFIRSDPGFGNGTPISVVANTHLDSLSIVVPIDGVPGGVSKLFLRFRDSGGSWSHTVERQFYKEVVVLESTAPEIVAGEYFINQDPGLGSGIPIPLMPSAHLDSLPFIVPLENVPNGFSKLYVRFKNAQGRWSHTYSRQFYKEDIPLPATAKQITDGEYFIGSDPGFGKGTPISVVANSHLDSLSIVVPIDGVPGGISKLYLRFRDSGGSWSHTVERQFYKEVVVLESTAPEIVAGEYFINQDPGLGSGIPISLMPSAHLDSLPFVVPLENVPNGFSKLYVRFKNAQGRWSHTYSRQFYKEEIPPGNLSNKIVEAEYFIDTDPGLGKGLPIHIASPNDTLDLALVVDLSTLRVGTHYLYVRAKDQSGNWGITLSSSFFVEPTTKPVISILNYPRAICTGTPFKVSFSMNTELAPDNVFTLQISSVSDNFNNPVNIGSIISATGDTITATIPTFVQDGNMYRFRIVSSAPKDTSAIVSNNVTVSNKPGAYFNILGESANCLGEKTYTISAPLPGVSYRWEFSGGSSLQTTSTTATTNWNQPGSFTIKAISSNQCGDGFSSSLPIQVFSGPPTAAPLISVSPDGNTLTSSPAGTENQATGYQWYFNGVPIDDATAMSYAFPDENIGDYSIRFKNPCGMGPLSVVYKHLAPKLVQNIAFSYASGLIFGALPFRISAVASSGLPVELSVIGGPGILFSTDSIRIVGGGTIRVQALQRGNSTYKSVIAFVDIPVGKAEAEVYLGNLEATYNGQPQHVRVSSSPSNLNIGITYAGQFTVPVDAGTYQVIATVLDNNYMGSDTAMLLIRKAGQLINTPLIGNKVVSDPFVKISAEASSRLPVMIQLQTVPASGVASLSGDTLRFLGLGSVSLTFNQPGNNNYSPAPQVIRNFLIEAPSENDISVRGIVTPSSRCINQDNTSLAVTVFNLGTNAQSNFEIGYRVGRTGSFVRKLVTTPLPANGTLEVEFDGQVKLPSGESEVQVVAFLENDSRRTNDTLSFSVFRLGRIENMSPADSTINLDNPIPLNWTPVEFASQYDLYVWRENTAKPAVPITVSQVVHNYYDYQIQYGGTYFWQVEAKNSRCATVSTVQRFSIRNLPDLVTREVTAPASAFSEQSISVVWKVLNVGAGSTAMASWYDDIYLSTDTIIQENVDFFIGSVQNLKALPAGQAYSHMAVAKLPRGIQGNFYILVRTGRYLHEADKVNNFAHIPIVINLNPPPDLTVSDVLVSPRNAFSGQLVEVSWKIKNQGQRSTSGRFFDQIFLSPAPAWNERSAIPVGGWWNNSSLAADATRNNSQTIRLPRNISGAYFVHVFTDLQNSVFEGIEFANNVAVSDTFNIFLTPPPDLAVTQVSVPTFVSNNQRVQVQWTIENKGANTPEDFWYDELFIGQSATFKPDSAIKLLTVPRLTSVAPTERYQGNANVTIPPTLQGNYFFYVLTDPDRQVFEFQTYANNTLRAVNSTTVLTADLVVESIDLPDQIISGTTLPLQWTIRNEGMGGVFNLPRRDEVYLSKSAVFAPNPNPSLDTVFRLLATLDYTGNQLSGQTLLRQADITIPEGISGKYYIHVVTDRLNRVFEGAGEGNNHRLDSVEIQLSPWPDLMPLSVEYPDTVGAGDNFMVAYQVKNQGTKTISGADSWMDQFFLYALPELDKTKAVQLGVNTVRQLVPRDSVYSGENKLFMPFLPSGYYYVFLAADDKNTLYEHTDEGNNLIRGKRIFVKSPPPVDFELTDAGMLPDTLFSGQNIQLNWTVTNRGNSTSVFGFSNWLDGVYLSEDPVWDEKEDLLIRDFGQLNPVPTLRDYKNRQTVRLPNGISGDRYLLVVADHLRRTNDSIRTNNTKSVIPQSGQPGKTFYIQLSPSPDLLPTYLQVPSPVVSGQPVQLVYRVKNIGNAATQVPWSDRVFFSRDFVIDDGDNSIGSKVQTRMLQPAEEYSDTIEIFIPVWAEQNFVLIFKTEANNAFYEHNGEENNMVNTIIIANRPLPSDLVVASVSPPEMAIVGESLAIDYEIGNIGKNPANGYMEEILYFSRDTLLDTGDVLIGKAINRSELIIPEATAERRFWGTVPGLQIGEYHVIVAADVRNNIAESSEINNVKASTQKVKITVPELPIDTTVNKTLGNQVPLFFRIEVPDSLNGATLLIALDGVSGENELFLSFGKMPTRSAHDFAFGSPSQPDQSIIVPELMTGTYYLLVYGASADGNAQAIKLKTQIIRFSILSVQSNKGGNTGNVTVRLDGAKFTPMMTAKLKSQTLGEVTANRIHFINSTRVFATFNLGGAKVGTYNVTLSRNGETATLPNGFTIVQGNPGIFTNASQNGNEAFTCNIVNIGMDEGLSETIDHPFSVLVNRVVPITIQYGNTGNVDIPIPSRFLISLNGEPLSFNIPGLSEGKQELFLQFQEIGGPPGILRPGSFCSLTVYSFSKRLIPVLEYMLRE